MSLRRSARIKTVEIPPQAIPAVKEATRAKSSKSSNGVPSNIKSRKTTKAKATEEMPPPPPPATPAKRKKSTAPISPKPPPLTPTPSAVGLMTAPYSTGDIDDSTPPPEKKRKARPAEPHMTNAPLHSQTGSQVIAMPADGGNITSSQREITTENLLEIAKEHLIKVDPNLRPVIEQAHCRIFSPEGLNEEVDPFRSLTSGIIAQQVSGAAAKSIKNKFIALFNEGNESQHLFPTPQQVVDTDLATLRLAGLSGRKAEYIQGLAEKFVSGELNAKILAESTDEEVIQRLTAVRGLGRWSAEMFACFALKRMDILSTGDLGVQRGMAAYVGRDVAKLKAKGGGKWKYMSEQDMMDISAKFTPYRSLFMWYMWRIEDVDVQAIQD